MLSLQFGLISDLTTSFNALKIMKHEMQGEFDPEFFARFVMLFSKKEYTPKSTEKKDYV